MGKKFAVCAAAAVVAATLASCSDDSGGKDGSTAAVDKVTGAINSAKDLQGELYDAVNRLVVQCMEDEDFDVHPLALTEPYGSGFDVDAEEASLVGSDPPGTDEIPTVKDAEKEGYGRNIVFGPDYEEEDSGLQKDDPFYSESLDYQRQYDETRYGEEFAAWMHGDGQDKAAEDGGNAVAMPLEAGCSGDIGKAVYGEPVKQEDADGQEVTPYYGVAAPAAMNDYDAQVKAFQTEKLVDGRDALATCIEDAGYPYFEYNEDWGMGMSYYPDGFYEDKSKMKNMSGTDRPEYDLPKGAPWPFDEAFAAEVEFATTVAQCADDTGYRKTMKSEWDNVMKQIAIDNEEAFYAWHDGLEKALGKAQDLLGE